MSESFDFEKSIERLEEITAKLEKGKLKLDEMTALYSEGTKLVASCGKKLEEAQLKITKITGENENDG
ncbi:MAG: exodeoxyribonuclease VII small subunit [Clostridia bacterium]|nr:exodeoxyribonuclease VII small subunit [Clostridia bacterium]